MRFRFFRGRARLRDSPFAFGEWETLFARSLPETFASPGDAW